MRKGLLALIFLVGSVFSNVVAAHAVGSTGTEIGTDSAIALARGNAMAANPEDPSTIIFNPAGLTKLEGTQVTMSATVIALLFEYEGRNGGQSEDSSVIPAVVPAFFTSFQTPIENFTAGFGVNSPFGLSTKYSSTGGFRYLGYYNELLTTNYMISGAYEINPSVSIGGGLSYMEADFKQNGKLNTSLLTGVPGQPDSPFEGDTDGDGWGWNAGVLITPDERQTIGLSYRSQVRLQMDGEFSADTLGFLAGTFGGAAFNTPMDLDFRMPDAVTAGYNYKVSDRLDVEFDTTWTGWSSLDRIHATFGQSNAVLNSLGSIDEDFNDTWSFHFGGSYKLNDAWTAMGGVLFYSMAENKANYSQVIPGGDRYALSTGLKYDWKDYTFSACAMIIRKAEVTIDNNVGSTTGAVVDGEYSGWIPLVSVGVTRRF